MKKIITSIIAGAALLFGFASCSGDLHDVNLIDLTGYGVRGTAKESGWDANNDVPLTKNADGSYSASFTATGTSSHGGDDFAIIQCGDASWSTAYRLAQPKAEGDKANVFDETNGMEQKVYLGQSADCCNIPSAKAGDKVTLTITPASTFLTVKVAIEAGAAPVASDPVPFVLSGKYLAGAIDLGAGTWGDAVGTSPKNALFNFTQDKDGNVLYEFVGNWAKSGGYYGFRLCDDKWANGYGNKELTVGEDFKELDDLNKVTDKKDRINDDGNCIVSGANTTDTYKIYIKTTPDKKVYAKVVVMNELTVTVDISGLPLDSDIIGATIYMTGDYNGWKTPESGKEADKVYPVDIEDDGTASFSFKVSYEGNTFSQSYNAKIASSGWTKPEIAGPDGENASFTITETKHTIKIVYSKTVTIEGNSNASENGNKYCCNWTVE